MAESVKAKSGLRTHDIGDNPTLWAEGLKAGINEFESRLGLTSEGDPNGQVAGSWYGQTCWDTEAGVMYECTEIGTIGTAVWTLRSALPTGAVIGGIWEELPSGFLPFDGTIRVRTSFPALFAVLPSTFKAGDNFTLPLIDNTAAKGMLLGMGGVGNVGTVVGSFTSDAHTITESEMGSKMDASPVQEAANPYSAGPRRLVRVVPETDTSPFEQPVPFTLTFSPRRLKLLVGIKY
jgi:hypothetical protein